MTGVAPESAEFGQNALFGVTSLWSARSTMMAQLRQQSALPSPVAESGDFVTVRHHTDMDSLRSIRQQQGLNSSRTPDPGVSGVNVEIAPFGPLRQAAGLVGAARQGAYVQFRVPRSAIVPTPGIGPLRAGYIPVAPTSTYSLRGTNPVFSRNWALNILGEH